MRGGIIAKARHQRRIQEDETAGVALCCGRGVFPNGGDGQKDGLLVKQRRGQGNWFVGSNWRGKNARVKGLQDRRAKHKEKRNIDDLKKPFVFFWKPPCWKRRTGRTGMVEEACGQYR